MFKCPHCKNVHLRLIFKSVFIYWTQAMFKCSHCKNVHMRLICQSLSIDWTHDKTMFMCPHCKNVHMRLIYKSEFCVCKDRNKCVELELSLKLLRPKENWDWIVFLFCLTYERI